MRIALDAMGGDHAPSPIVRGAVEAVEANSDLHVVLVGDEAQIRPAMGAHVGSPQLSIHHCTQVLGMHEKPSALRSKPDNSISRCWELMALGKVQAVVSAGNTGAVAGAGLFAKRFLRGVYRPGIAVVMPTARGSSVLLDVGANAACKAEHLFQYGQIGAVYARKILGVANPTVGLINIGSEEGKGTELYKTTRTLFSNSYFKSQFVGNVEGRELFQGMADVVVSDGFVGNVVLKVSEGMFDLVLDMCRGQAGTLPAEHRPGALGAIETIADKYHHTSFGGAPLLGIDGICIICHGSSGEKSIRNALAQAVRHNDAHLNEQIVAELDRQSVPEVAETVVQG